MTDSTENQVRLQKRETLSLDSDNKLTQEAWIQAKRMALWTKLQIVGMMGFRQS